MKTCSVPHLEENNGSNDRYFIKRRVHGIRDLLMFKARTMFTS